MLQLFLCCVCMYVIQRIASLLEIAMGQRLPSTFEPKHVVRCALNRVTMANWEAILKWSLKHHDGTAAEPRIDEEVSNTLPASSISILLLYIT